MKPSLLAIALMATAALIGGCESDYNDVWNRNPGASAPPPPPPPPPAPDYSAIEDAIRTGTTATGDSSIIEQVPNGGSCVEASEKRADSVAANLQNVSAQGKMPGVRAEVGTLGGYWVPGVGSVHTYTVVKIVDDRTGKTLKTYTSDNYLGPTTISSDDSVWPLRPGNVDWKDDYASRRSTVGPSRPRPGGGGGGGGGGGSH
ncbi:hypothetical protein [Zavarzinia sp. CC-PAN008]|uniref:hypothetical protein n=1 Tax=Zavarzinia sp. CC-PAN008 TaxID=3243332 RepID=UPI003F74285B